MVYVLFVVVVGLKFFGLESFIGLLDLKDLKDYFEGLQFVKWQSFCQFEDFCYVVLIVLCFLLCMFYDLEENLVKLFVYKEIVVNSYEYYLWGNIVYVFGIKLIDSFVKYCWCLNIIGLQSGGVVEDLLLYYFESMGEIEIKIFIEVLVFDCCEYELVEEGFIFLIMCKGSDNVVFFFVSLVQKLKFFGISVEGKVVELNYKFGIQLLYMMIVNCLVYYLKVL